jgi:hypothetical protein
MTRGTCELIFVLQGLQKRPKQKASEIYFWKATEAPSSGWFPKDRRIHVRIKLRNIVYLNSHHFNLWSKHPIWQSNEHWAHNMQQYCYWSCGRQYFVKITRGIRSADRQMTSHCVEEREMWCENTKLATDILSGIVLALLQRRVTKEHLTNFAIFLLDCPHIKTRNPFNRFSWNSALKNSVNIYGGIQIWVKIGHQEHFIGRLTRVSLRA